MSDQVFIIILCTAVPPRAEPLTRLQWRRGADTPEGFSGAQAVMVGENVYVGGGTTECKIFQYNWNTGTWYTLPDCPLKSFGLTQYRGRLTTVGGLTPLGIVAQVYNFTKRRKSYFALISSVYEFVS